MPEFFAKLLGLIQESRGWLESILIPTFIILGLAFSMMFGVASDQNKGKWKAALITLLVIVVIAASVGYVIPWFYQYFA
ncbi:hypothetical protein [Erysipelothrix aquatica]|uniref:hypothetical protein n=1 Tax=Erysipelothrix aquatica TaxID=2683714 RepID=UPI00135AAFB0|nr:hypothetical protein [Erysipelothrix aquatica]